MPFVALVDFWSDETKSQYCKGMTYTARTEELRGLVEVWLSENKVSLDLTAIPSSSVRGTDL